MLKKILFLLIMVAFVSNAQFRRIALLEEATNASCAPCAANNPNLQEFFEHGFGGVVSVRYHAWWPGSDPMYSHNSAENRARIQYYGISGVPGYTMDGVFKGVPGNPETMRREMMEDLSEGSPIWIDIKRTSSQDSVIFSVKIIAGADVEGTNLKLRNAIIERRKVYTSPPGSNGEKIFNDVFRKMLPGTDGESLSGLAEGDTLSFSYAYPINSEWNPNDLAVVSWVQNDNDKRVIQANIDVPTFYTKSDSPFAEIVESGETVEKVFKLVNDNPDTIRVAFANAFDIPDDWNATFEILDSNSTENLAVILPQDSLAVKLTLNVGAEKGTGKISIYPQNIDDPYNYGFSADNLEFLPNGNVLLIDADGGKRYELYYKVAFEQIDMPYSILDKGVIPALADDLLAYNWKAVYWNTAWGFPAFIFSDIEFLTNYLNAGGNLFIAGQDIGWDIFDPSGSSRFPEATNFYNTYLGAAYLGDDAGSYSVTGVSGDPITDGISFSVSAIHQRYPESIDTSGGASTVILKYANGQNCAVKNETGNYKTVYLGVGLEQVGNEAARVALVENSLIWFGVINDVNESELPVKLALEQNYPNPFNPATTIVYSLPQNKGRNADVTLKIYDVLGREVATLVNEKQQAGVYSVRFNAAALSSGIYFYELRYGSVKLTRKMMLLK